MAEDILKQEIIAKHISILYKEVRALKRDKFLKEREEEMGAVESPNNRDFATEFRTSFDAVIVTTILSDNTFGALRTIADSTDDPGWIIDPEFASKPLTVTRPQNGAIPVVGDIVPVFFTGTFDVAGVATPRYGFFTRSRRAGRYEAPTGQVFTSGLEERITFVDGGKVFNTTDGGVTLSAGEFSFADELIGKLIMYGASASFQDDPDNLGFLAANGKAKIETNLGTANKPSATYTGLDATALTTDSANGPDPHTHTIPDHTHGASTISESDAIHLSTPSAIWLIESGDTFSANLSQTSESGVSAQLRRATIWWVVLD